MSEEGGEGNSSELISKLEYVLKDLHAYPFPVVDSPPGLKKRASIALIVRIRPTYSHWPNANNGEYSFIHDASIQQDGMKKIESFFAQEWVQRGDPEVLFIKRASRKGDPWTGHVALPGGGRDQEDSDDKATAIREAAEEVGVDLSESNAIEVGNLPQRLVTANWGKTPIMVLCPYMFLLHRHDLPPLKLQPSEVAAAHWVPIRALLSSTARDHEYANVTARLAKEEFGIKRLYYECLMLGRMMFAAIKLFPSESIYCSSVPGFLPEKSSTRVENANAYFKGHTKSTTIHTAPLHLWGLTLGIMTDLLELLPPYNALLMWTYPSFTFPDIRFLTWFLSRGFRREKFNLARTKPARLPASVDLDAKFESIASIPTHADERKPPPGAGEAGLGVIREHEGPSRERVKRSWHEGRIGFMLDGYYEILNKAVRLALLGRAVTVITLFTLIYRFRKRLARK